MGNVEVMVEIKSTESYIKKNFKNLGRIKSLKRLSSGPNAEVHFLKTKDNDYVLHEILDKQSIIRIKQTCKILKYLKKNKILVQELVCSDNGSFYDLKNNCYMTKFYPGEFSNGTDIEIKGLATNIAKLHKVLEKTKISYNYEHDTDPFFNILTESDIIRIKKIIINKINKTNFDRRILKQLKFLDKIIHQQSNNKRPVLRRLQLIHNDLTMKNVIFYKKNLKVFLDFDGMKKGDILEDIAFASLRFSTISNLKKTSVEKKINIFLDSYLEENEFSDKRLQNLSNYSMNDLLSKLSYIIKKKYYKDDDSWIFDFEPLFRLLKCSDKISWPE